MPRRVRLDGRPPISALFKPLYVLQMNWQTLSDESRIKWLRSLRAACTRTTVEIDAEIKRIQGR
jgi:hypothetical protein